MAGQGRAGAGQRRARGGAEPQSVEAGVGAGVGVKAVGKVGGGVEARGDNQCKHTAMAGAKDSVSMLPWQGRQTV